MFPPIPGRIMQETLFLSVPASFDRYQAPAEGTPIEVAHVHFQPTNKTVLSATNDEVQLSGIIFVDARRCSPALDYEALQQAVQQAGGVMTVTVRTRRGTEIGPMAVVDVEALPDDEANLHHWELGVR